MKKLLLLATLFAGAAIAGLPPYEKGLKAPNDALEVPRKLTISDGGSLVTNVDLSTAALGRNPAQFQIPTGTVLSVQCPDAGAWFYPNVTTVSPGRGIMIAQGGFLSPIACTKDMSVLQGDGGTYRGCVVAMAPLAGQTSNECIVHALGGSF